MCCQQRLRRANFLCCGQSDELPRATNWGIKFGSGDENHSDDRQRHSAARLKLRFYRAAASTCSTFCGFCVVWDYTSRLIFMFIITAVGRDRPGMAHALAQTLAALGCNLEDTTMTRLSGEFAMILIVTPPIEIGRDEVARTLKPLHDSHGLFIMVRPIEDENVLEISEGARYIVTVYGPDSVGLLAAFSGVFARYDVNLTDVQTRNAVAGNVYVMIFEIELPISSNLETLRAALDEQAAQSGVTLSLHALDEEVL